MIAGMSSCGKMMVVRRFRKAIRAEIKPIQLLLPEYNGRNGKFRQE